MLGQAAASLLCLKKTSNSALIRFFKVETIPCGAPGMTFSVAPFTNLRRLEELRLRPADLIVVAVKYQSGQADACTCL